jgi:hypothetical protein
MVLSATRGSPISREASFFGSVMIGGTFVTLAIARLVSMKVVEWLLAALRQRSTVPVVRVKSVVDVTVEAMGTVKPWTCSYEQPADKPVGAIVAIRCAVVWCIVEVPIGTHRRHSNVDADGDLG